MAYNTNNPPVLLASRFDGGSGSLWSYISTDDLGTISGSGYFSNAFNVGLKVGDVILCSESDNSYAPALVTIASISSGAATVNASEITAGTGVTTGVGTIYEAGVESYGGIKKTTIITDLTGLNCGGTAGDIIGVQATANSHFGQLTAARSGAIFMGRITCLEVPTGGNADIDLWTADEATGTEDAAITGLTNEVQLCNSGTFTLGLAVVFTAFPVAGQYLYLVCGTATDATYTAGKFLIEFWGV